MSGALIPVWRWQISDDDGQPLPGALLYTFLSGTDTPHAVFADVDLTVPLPNPVVADSGGVLPAIFLDAVAYRMQVNNAEDETVYPAQDNITNLAQVTGSGTDVTGTAGVNLTAREVVYLSDGSGSLTAGRWYKGDADFTYASISPEVGFVVSDATAGAAVTVRMLGRMTGFTGLGAGSIYYISATAGAITSSAPTNARVVGQADTTTTLVIGPIGGGASSAAGSDTEVQFNDGGMLGADTDFTFDASASPEKLLSVPAIDLSAGQISFPSTQNASSDNNTLDDYVAKTAWTPRLGGTTSESGQAYSAQVGYYTKIGRQVTAHFKVVLSSAGTFTGDLVLKGLPFTPDAAVYTASSVDFFSNVGVWYTTLIEVSTGTAALIGFLDPSGRQPIDSTALTNTSGLQGCITYIAAS